MVVRERWGRQVITVGHQLDRTENHWLVIGSIAAAGLVNIILGVATLNGFQSSGSGDLVVSSTMGSGLNLAIVVVGILALLSLELAHVTRCWPVRAKVIRASCAAHA